MTVYHEEDTALMELKLKILDQNGFTKAASPYGSRASLVWSERYQPGDRILVETGGKPAFCVVQLDDAMPEALIYVTNGVDFRVPFGEGKISYSPKSFSGEKHLIRARFAEPEEIERRRCLSFNPYDCHENSGSFPHALANVETRGESVFAARNAIDGIFENASHGEWPYQSWGINRDPNACLTIQFGRRVRADELRLTLRADFPHDSHWVRATAAFSDGTEETFPLEKTPLPQRIAIEPREIDSVTLKNLIKADDPSPFPALTQIEVWGVELL